MSGTFGLRSFFFIYSMNTLTILQPSVFEQCHYGAVVRLLSQLTSRPVSFGEEAYCRLLEAPHSHLFLLLEEDTVVGMLTVGIYLSPTGSKAWIEDVVIDEACRGRGYGRVLVAHAIDYCIQEGIDTLMLTSNPRRVAANALYRSLGFEQKETNVYRMSL